MPSAGVVAIIRGVHALALLLMLESCIATAAAHEPSHLQPSELLTNLFPVRHFARQKPAVARPFRIMAEVLDADSTNGLDLRPNSPSDIRVPATPTWRILERALVLAGILAALLGAILIWNKELHRSVQARCRRLEMEIRHQQQAELLRAADAERSRIARDLHDELGAGLTEVSLLASAGLGEFSDAKKHNDRFRAIAEKTRALVSELDVIVWAIDPKRDSLQSFADYVGSYAKELLAVSNVVCRLKIPIECDAITLTGTMRHHLFLAVKEALSNAVRHASATEVELQISQLDGRLQIIVADNGCGFDWNTIWRGNGLTNLQERLESLHGQCHIESRAGNGTTVKLTVPAPDNLK